jgi:hypothetical protein
LQWESNCPKAEGVYFKWDITPLYVESYKFFLYQASSNDLVVVRCVSQIESEILLIATSKFKYVEAKCKKILNMIVGFKFLMDDHHIAVKEDEEKVFQ